MGTARVVYRSATSVWQKRWGGDLSDGEKELKSDDGVNGSGRR